MKPTVLDASALVTFFEDRSGADKVEEILAHGVASKAELLMSAVNWGEVYYSVWRVHGQRAALKAAAEIAQLPIEIVAAGTELTTIAAELRARFKLPYADCFAAALAKHERGRVVTCDRDFSLVQPDIEILFI